MRFWVGNSFVSVLALPHHSTTTRCIANSAHWLETFQREPMPSPGGAQAGLLLNHPLDKFHSTSTIVRAMGVIIPLFYSPWCRSREKGKALYSKVPQHTQRRPFLCNCGWGVSSCFTFLTAILGEGDS